MGPNPIEVVSLQEEEILNTYRRMLLREGTDTQTQREVGNVNMKAEFGYSQGTWGATRAQRGKEGSST